MAGQEKTTVVRDLIELGKSKGKLTTSEINDALEELDFDVEQVDKLYETLEGLNVEIVENYAQNIEIDFPLPRKRSWKPPFRLRESASTTR